MRLRWKFHLDGITLTNVATGPHDAHDTGLANHTAILCTTQHLGQQAVLEVIDLPARIAETGYLDNGLFAEVEQRSGGEAEEVYATCGDVLAQFSWPDGVAGFGELVVELAMDEVYLTQVRLCRITLDATSVPHGDAQVRVSLDTETGDQPNTVATRLAERMRRTDAHRCDNSYHLGPLTALTA